MRAAIYVRVSTEEQRKHGLSVDSQIDALQKYCEQEQYTIVGIYNDAGISARKKYTSRPALLRLIEDCKQRKVDIILFTKLDRWFRSVADYYAVQQQIDKVPWKAIWEDYETLTSAGVFKVNIMLSVAQAESDRTGERIRAVRQYQRENGLYSGSKAPVGYRRIPKGIEIDPDTQAGVAAFFAAYFEKCSLVDAMEAAEENGVHISSKVRACRMLLNTTYRGNAYGYACPAYITEQQGRVIDLRRKEFASHTRTPDRVYLFTGLLYCQECGSRLASKTVTHKRKDGTKADTKYYVCNAKRQKICDCTGAYANEDKLERKLLQSFDSIMQQYASAKGHKKSQRHQKDTSAKVKNLKERLGRIKELYIDGDIDRKTYNSRKAQIEAQLKALDQQPEERLYKPLPYDWREMYESLSEDMRHAFWMRNITRIIIPVDRDADFDVII